MIRYLNKDGDRISRETWDKLYRDPGYADLHRTRVTENLLIETSWVGVAAEWESPAKIFVTIVRQKNVADLCYWTPTRRAAAEAHNAAIWDHQPKKQRKKA